MKTNSQLSFVFLSIYGSKKTNVTIITPNIKPKQPSKSGPPPPDSPASYGKKYKIRTNHPKIIREIKNKTTKPNPPELVCCS